MRFTKEQGAAARKVPLADFLLSRYPGELECYSHGRYRLSSNHAIKINRGIPGYQNWLDNTDHGNSVDYLIRYHGRSLQEAVLELYEYASGQPAAATDLIRTAGARDPSNQARRPFRLPEQAADDERVRKYLSNSRGLEKGVVSMLIGRGLLYESIPHHNAVFVNADKTFYEMRGTAPERPFHQSYGKTGNECWYFSPLGGKTAIVYVCESSIDAISLFLLRKETDAAYAGIGGAGKQAAIDRIKSVPGIRCIIAADSDAAGDKCRENNPGCETIRPENKDWNEDLLMSVKAHQENPAGIYRNTPNR